MDLTINKMSERISTNNSELNDLTISRAESAISTELDNETIILDTSSGVYSGLDLVGTTIWDTIENPTSFSKIVQTILADYSVSEQECISDLIKFLHKLSDLNLIVAHGASAKYISKTNKFRN